jgi:hypothetical protein
MGKRPTGTNRHHWRSGVHHLDRPAVAVLLNASAGRAYHITPAGDAALKPSAKWSCLSRGRSGNRTRFVSLSADNGRSFVLFRRIGGVDHDGQHIAQQGRPCRRGHRS